MATQERGTRSRHSILESAARVFDERGYDAASTNDILARTGLLEARFTTTSPPRKRSPWPS